MRVQEVITAKEEQAHESMREFANHARRVYKVCGREAVALIRVFPNGQTYETVLINRARGRRSFHVSSEDLTRAIQDFAKCGATRWILAHSHEKGRAVPSNMYPGGDVQNLGDPRWIAWIEGLLRENGIQPPLLHLVYSVKADRQRLFRIDQRIGLWTTRKFNGHPVRVRLGWEEVAPHEVQL